MKKTKVIIPALGLLLLSTAASVTGTVAWFAANASVSATGMNITATTDSTYLVISRSATLASLNTVAIENPVSGSVLPTNWVNDTTWKWVTGAGTATNNGTLSGSYTALTGISESSHLGSKDGKNYYVYDSVFVGLATGSSVPTGKKLVCDVKFTPTEVNSAVSAYNACLTVGLDVGADRTADFDKKFVYGNGTAGTGDDDGKILVNHAAADSLIAGADLGTTGTEIKIYAYFDGDNAACTTANAINLGQVSFDLIFSLVDAQ